MTGERFTVQLRFDGVSSDVRRGRALPRTPRRRFNSRIGDIANRFIQQNHASKTVK